MKNKTLVPGLGDTLLGDGGAGVQAVRAIAATSAAMWTGI